MDADTEKLIREMWSDFSTALRNVETRLTERMDRRFDLVDRRFERMEQRFDALDQRVAGLEKRVDGLEKRVARLEAASDKLGSELAAFKRVVLENFQRVQRNFELLLAEVRDPAHKARLDKIEDRLARLEQHIGLSTDE